METISATTPFSYHAPTVLQSRNKPAEWQNKSIQRSRRGDLDAFNELVLAYQDIVFRQAFWMLNDEEAAADAAQEVFMLVYRKLNTYDGRSFCGWILRITTNYCLDKIRSAARHPQVSLYQTNDDEGEECEPEWIKDPGVTPEQAVERAEMEHRITCAIQKLSPEYRGVVIMIDLQELDYAEAASVLHLPIGTIKSRLARGRYQIRKDLLKTMWQ